MKQKPKKIPKREKDQSNVIDSEGKVNAPDFLKGNNSFKGKSGYK